MRMPPLHNCDDIPERYQGFLPMLGNTILGLTQYDVEFRYLCDRRLTVTTDSRLSTASVYMLISMFH